MPLAKRQPSRCPNANTTPECPTAQNRRFVRTIAGGETTGIPDPIKRPRRGRRIPRHLPQRTPTTGPSPNMASRHSTTLDPPPSTLARSSHTRLKRIMPIPQTPDFTEKFKLETFLFESTGFLFDDPALPISAGKRSGALAQLVEHLHGMQGVSGSNPLCSTFRSRDPTDPPLQAHPPCPNQPEDPSSSP